MILELMLSSSIKCDEQTRWALFYLQHSPSKWNWVTFVTFPLHHSFLPLSHTPRD